MEDVLTEEQFAKYQKMKKEQKEKRTQKRKNFK
jgi:hypothetical protein